MLTQKFFPQWERKKETMICLVKDVCALFYIVHNWEKYYSALHWQVRSNRKVTGRLSTIPFFSFVKKAISDYSALYFWKYPCFHAEFLNRCWNSIKKKNTANANTVLREHQFGPGKKFTPHFLLFNSSCSAANKRVFVVILLNLR